MRRTGSKLGDPIEVLAMGEGMEADPQPAHPERVRQRPELAHVTAQFGAHLVHVLRLCARQLELAARFQRD